MSQAPKAKLRIVPLGGLGEIGMNCMVMEYDDEIIVIDCGLLFSDLEHFGVEFVIPDFTYLKDRADKIKAFVMTHGHEDHIGALAFALRAGLRAPVYCSKFTSLLITERLKEHGLLDRVDLNVFRMGEQLEIGKFKIRTVGVNHSIVDAAALIIDTPVGRVVHTGDFKIDPTPYYGSQIDMDAFKQAGDEGVLLLLSDSTNVERHDHSMSENKIYDAFERIFAAAEGMIVVSMFASNVARMGQAIAIAEKLGKKVAASGRSMEQNIRLAAEAGYLQNASKTVIELDEIRKYPRDQVVVLATGSQGEYRSSLMRMSLGEHRQVKLEKNDIVVMSSRSIPGNEKAISRIINNLFKQGADVLYGAMDEIHTSGHATRPELERMLQAVRPKFFVPVHGEYRMLVHHSRLAAETGVKETNAVIAANGDVIELTRESCEIVEQLELDRVLIEGHAQGDISKLVLKDRRKLGETGVVFALMVRNAETGRIIAGPEVISKGLVKEEFETELLGESKRLLRDVVNNYEKRVDDGFYDQDLQETVRVELRRFFNHNLGNKPTVVPIVLDV